MEATAEARRVKFHDARRHFEAGGTVLVSEHGHARTRPVFSSTTTHDRTTTTWDELATQVREWRSRYPNQRFYIVEPLCGECGTVASQRPHARDCYFHPENVRASIERYRSLCGSR